MRFVICEPATQATLFQIHIFRRCWNIFLHKESHVENSSYTSFTHWKFSLFENNAEKNQSYMFVWWLFSSLNHTAENFLEKKLDHMPRN